MHYVRLKGNDDPNEIDECKHQVVQDALAHALGFIQQGTKGESRMEKQIDCILNKYGYGGCQPLRR